MSQHSSFSSLTALNATKKAPNAVAGYRDERARPRRCGRCRGTFAGDPTLDSSAEPEWWLCPPCHEALLGSGRRRS
jgi:hypothetical protein